MSNIVIQNLEEILNEMEAGDPEVNSNPYRKNTYTLGYNQLQKSFSSSGAYQAGRGSSFSQSTAFSPISSSSGMSPVIDETREDLESSPNADTEFFKMIPCKNYK